MPTDPKIAKVIIPALNEQESISKVIKELPKKWISEIIVVDNGSVDKTASIARSHGATVLSEPQRGYGKACLKGLHYIKNQQTRTDIVIFIDADYSDYPADIEKIITPILKQNYDFVLGARVKHLQEKGAMTLPQRFGNLLATFLMHHLYNSKFTDLGPLRAIKYDKLISLGMQDTTYGWTIEMQLKALKHKLKYLEIPVRYKKRIGTSKISGTIKGVIMAGYKILSWIFKYRKG